MVIILKPLSNQELYRIIDNENKSIEEFRRANPQFQVDNSNIVSTIEELEHFEHLYSHMGLGTFEFAPSEFNFKRADSYTFQQIFSDNFDSFLINNPSINIRPVVIDEINKMISCQDPSMGHAIYECPTCHKSYCVPFTCKSRFCNTCAIKYQMDRALHVYDLIKRLIIHIPDKNFKMLRYAGLYSSHKCAHFDKLIKKLSDASIKTKKMLASYWIF